MLRESIKKSKKMPWLALAASFAWLVLTGVLYRQAVQTNAEHSLELEHTRLSTMAQQLMDARNWNAAHGGVYVAQSDYGQPNPWLPTSEQTVTTRDGRTLVLVNPAYMSRQLAERSSHEGVTISVISNAPLRPESEVNVLLLGETGVGKELFARALFRNSARAAKPFITVDCASLPETLVESHLFGHSRGAFTGADRARDGLLLAADKGTLFLDEVGDLPQPMQGVFLRALEQRRFRPVGEVREVSSDFRLVAATNKNLELMAKENSFRSDLLYRLQGITIVIPPLRERLDEIPALAQQAITRFCLASDQREKNLSDDTLGMLLEYAWPGNVRELIHCIQRACLAAGKSDLLLPVHLPTHMRVDCVRRRMGQAAGLPGSAGGIAATVAAAPGIAASCGFSAQEMAGQDVAGQNPPSLREWKLQAERAYVRQVWDLSGEDVRKAAEVAGISRGHWYELMKKIGL